MCLKQNFHRIIVLTLRLKYFYSSTPKKDLNNSLFVKSKSSKCKYIYLQHSPMEVLPKHNDKAFDVSMQYKL